MSVINRAALARRVLDEADSLEELKFFLVRIRAWKYYPNDVDLIRRIRSHSYNPISAKYFNAMMYYLDDVIGEDDWRVIWHASFDLDANSPTLYAFTPTDKDVERFIARHKFSLLDDCDISFIILDILMSRRESAELLRSQFFANMIERLNYINISKDYGGLFRIATYFDHGALNWRSHIGLCPIHYLVGWGYGNMARIWDARFSVEDAVERLKRWHNLGMDLSVRTAEGRTPAQIARDSNLPHAAEIADYLDQFGN